MGVLATRRRGFHLTLTRSCADGTLYWPDRKSAEMVKFVSSLLNTSFTTKGGRIGKAVDITKIAELPYHVETKRDREGQYIDIALQTDHVTPKRFYVSNADFKRRDQIVELLGLQKRDGQDDLLAKYQAPDGVRVVIRFDGLHDSVERKPKFARIPQLA